LFLACSFGGTCDQESVVDFLSTERGVSKGGVGRELSHAMHMFAYHLLCIQINDRKLSLFISYMNEDESLFDNNEVVSGRLTADRDVDEGDLHEALQRQEGDAGVDDGPDEAARLT